MAQPGWAQSVRELLGDIADEEFDWVLTLLALPTAISRHKWAELVLYTCKEKALPASHT